MRGLLGSFNPTRVRLKLYPYGMPRIDFMLQPHKGPSETLIARPPSSRGLDASTPQGSV